MKSIATPWRSTPLTGFRDCKKSGPTPRRNSETNRSNAVPTHTRMASITRTLRDGGGRTGRNKLANEEVAGTLTATFAVPTFAQRLKRSGGETPTKGAAQPLEPHRGLPSTTTGKFHPYCWLLRRRIQDDVIGTFLLAQ